MNVLGPVSQAQTAKSPLDQLTHQLCLDPFGVYVGWDFWREVDFSLIFETNILQPLEEWQQCCLNNLSDTEIMLLAAEGTHVSISCGSSRIVRLSITQPLESDCCGVQHSPDTYEFAPASEALFSHLQNGFNNSIYFKVIV